MASYCYPLISFLVFEADAFWEVSPPSCYWNYFLSSIWSTCSIHNLGLINTKFVAKHMIVGGGEYFLQPFLKIFFTYNQIIIWYISRLILKCTSIFTQHMLLHYVATPEHTHLIARLQEAQGSLWRIVRCKNNICPPASRFSFTCGSENYCMGHHCYETIHVRAQVAIWYIMHE
jgi:hypothetical protein